MRVMVLVKATKNSESGVLPTERGMTDMGLFNEELVKAGVMQAGEGLKPSRAGKRVQCFVNGTKKVVDGPFAETRELVAGYWIWEVKSVDHAVEWLRRCPDCMPGEDYELEIRPIYEAADFGEAYTPELQAQEERMRAEVARKN